MKIKIAVPSEEYRGNCQRKGTRRKREREKVSDKRKVLREKKWAVSHLLGFLDGDGEW